MRYIASLTDYTKSPRWGMTLLLETVCVLIPYVGGMVLYGYHLRSLMREHDHPDQPRDAFEFEDFIDYLTIGLWPFLVGLVVSLVMMPLLMVVMIPFYVVIFTGADEPIIVIMVIAMVAIMVPLSLIMGVIATPMTLASALQQNFAAGFRMDFIKDFLSKMWMECLLAQLFMGFAGFVLSIGGMLACYVGLFPAMVLILFMNVHLSLQLYYLYLERGGKPLEVDARLQVATTPPAPNSADASVAGDSTPASPAQPGSPDAAPGAEPWEHSPPSDSPPHS